MRKREVAVESLSLMNLEVAPEHVIDGDLVYLNVGIGWIELRKATMEDRKKIPAVKR